MSVRIVDGYCHCGLRKHRPVEDVRRMMERHNVERAVLVQHMGEYDNSYIEQAVRADPERFAGVLMVDVDRDDRQETLGYWVEKKVFRGIRMVARTLETHAALWEQVARSGLHVVLYQEPTIAGCVESLSAFAESYPQTHLILAHIGRLDPAESPRFESFDRVLSLAQRPNVFLQVSGMDAFAEPPFTELAPLVSAGVEAFGADRTFYGTNYPACRSEDAYGQDIDLLLTGRLGVQQQYLEQVACGTAQRLWFD